MFSATDELISQWESNVLVSPIKAPALMIFDVYGGEAEAETPFFFFAARTAITAPGFAADPIVSTLVQRNFFTAS